MTATANQGRGPRTGHDLPTMSLLNSAVFEPTTDERAAALAAIRDHATDADDEALLWAVIGL